MIEAKRDGNHCADAVADHGWIARSTRGKGASFASLNTANVLQCTKVASAFCRLKQCPLRDASQGASGAFHCYNTMEHALSSRQILSDARAVLADELAEALVLLNDRDDARALLADLCTPAEIHTLAERWHVAKLLDAGALTYREIHEATGVSTTTIVRVARFLRQENNGGYRVLLDRLGAGR